MRSDDIMTGDTDGGASVVMATAEAVSREACFHTVVESTLSMLRMSQECCMNPPERKPSK